MDIKKEKEDVPLKSSTEILTELFSVFNTEPPKLDEEKLHKKHKKSKKKHKHKDKKHKKKKHKRSSVDSENSSDSDGVKRKHKKKRRNSVSDCDSRVLVDVKKEPDKDFVNGVKVKEEKTDDSYEVRIKDEPKDDTKPTEQKESIQPQEKETNSSVKTASSKILIKDLKNSEIYEKTVKEAEEQARQKLLKIEEGEIVDSGSDSRSDDIPNDHVLDDSDSLSFTKRERKRKHRSRSAHKESKKLKKSEKDSSHRNNTDHHGHSKDRHAKSSHSHKTHSDHKYRRKKRNSRSYSRERSNSRTRHRSEDRSYSHHRSRSRRSKSPTSSIDKKKLLEIARKNAINMLKSGTLPDALSLGPQAQEKVIAAIKAGGKTIEELTDFCKNLSKKEALGELSSISSAEDDGDSEDGNGVDRAFHHPFQIKDKPSSIVMNIKVYQ